MIPTVVPRLVVSSADDVDFSADCSRFSSVTSTDFHPARSRSSSNLRVYANDIRAELKRNSSGLLKPGAFEGRNSVTKPAATSSSLPPRVLKRFNSVTPLPSTYALFPNTLPPIVGPEEIRPAVPQDDLLDPLLVSEPRPQTPRRKLINPFRKLRNTKRIMFCTLSIFIVAVYRYSAGKSHVPLSCNLLNLKCPVWPINGFVKEGYEGVAEAFKENFDAGWEVGAGFAVYSRLVDQGYLTYDTLIADVWPEFAQGGKENVTLTDLLGHRAGVTYLKRGPTLSELADLDKLAKLLAAQPHNFGGKKVQGYAGVTRGWYLNEIVRRVHPRKWTIGQILRHEIMPLLNIDFHLGIETSHESRISPLVGPPALRSLAKILTPNHLQKDPPSPVVRTMLFNPLSVSHKALRNSAPRQMRPWPASHNRKEIWRSEGPSYGGLSNARSLAKLSAIMANYGHLDGVTIVSETTARRAFEPLDTQLDAVVRRNITFTRGGFGIDVSFPGTSEIDWIGWGGVGGSLVYWNPDYRLAFSYVPNTMGFTSMGDRRSWRLLKALMKAWKEQTGIKL
ncbi:hypothetical protein HDV05_006961 [Chytridiales sp. JEL 0842]|nr:hypothetical protein HDV05_006961 [Chytridiales sp. JEL 0842]